MPEYRSSEPAPAPEDGAGSTDSSRWRRVRELFEELLELPAPARGAALAGLDVHPTIRAELERLLDADRIDDGLLSPGTSPAAVAAALARATAETRDAPDEPLPRRLSSYDMLSRLGAGGMGEVYLAHDARLDRKVALKLLSRQLTQDPAWLARFAREARSVSALNHPNILTIHEVGESGGIHFIATEFIEGRTLRDHLARGPLPCDVALDVAAQIAAALAAAHAVGIVHRDIKPENVMLRPDGYVKVLDFGLAKLTGPGGPATDHTTPGLLMGTTSYMSPEQARGLEVDARTDVFSLGVVLYEMLTGRAPFAGETPSDVLVAILGAEPPRPSASVPDLPRALDRLVARALHKDREARHQTARELRQELRALLRRLEQPVEAGGSLPAPAGAGPGAGGGHEIPPVRYARSGDVNLAYQVVGDAGLDVVFVMGWISHLEYFWSEPSFARFLRRLASFARVILFDKRGTGLSDRVPPDQLPTLEQRMDDVRAVMDAVGSKRAVLCGVSEGGPMCALFAATYPEKTIALVMIGSYARRLRGEGYPWGPTLEEREGFFEEIRSHWGGPVGLAERAPTVADDPRFRAWWAAYLRHGASPSAALALTRMNTEIDIRKVLPSVQAPTLVLHRTGDLCLRVEEGRYLAQHIPGAKFVELPGIDHLPFVGDQDMILDQIAGFLAGTRHASEFDRVLATVLVAEAAGFDRAAGERERRELAAAYRTCVEREIAAGKGRFVEADERALLAVFDGPARAIRAACSMVAAAARLGIDVEAGLHTGECDCIGDRLGGLAVEVARQVSGRSSPGRVVVSSTVKDLVAGSGIQFAPHGELALPGELGDLRLFRVEHAGRAR
jgi:pimeloyl-ACP methyl ester carboxylesterase/class 3 adenylate cyclase